MPVHDIYSKRKAALESNLLPLQTLQIPAKLRTQFAQICLASIGKYVTLPKVFFGPPPAELPSNQVWDSIQKVLCSEHGRFMLTENPQNSVEDCMSYMLQVPTDDAVDVMEVCLRHIDWVVREWDAYQRHDANVSQTPDGAIEEFNIRCRENGVGFAYKQGRIVSVSSAFVHNQIVEPALILLYDSNFKASQAEFLKAHEHFRKGHWEAAIVEAGKAFESTMKTTCTRKGWQFDAGAQVRHLVAELLNNGFIPQYMQTQLAHLRGLLETGVNVVRNQEGAHGRGDNRNEASRETAEYALHLTAVNIVFLVNLFKAS